MNKLVRKVEWELPGSPKTKMFMYGEASVEANKEMQEPLEKLYQYEKQPDMLEKIKEYINELDMEIKRVNDILERSDSPEPELYGRITTLIEVKNDLQGRLEEVI